VASAIEREGIRPVVRIVGGQEAAGLPRPAVVVGTLAAAHAVGRVGCVCVSDLDQLLVRPDFRSSEHALQLLHELAWIVAPGGRFLVQTREPDHYVVQAFTRGSYDYFMRRELPFRRETSYPPYGEVVKVEGSTERLNELSSELGVRARLLVAPGAQGRSVALLRTAKVEDVLDSLHGFAHTEPKVRIDVDPVDVL
jgi:primosomal protein N'